MPQTFVQRSDCRACGAGAGAVLASCAYTDDRVWPLIETYYKGRIARDDLAGGSYEIRRCATCGFVWQGQILDDAGMETLYETWVQPEESLRKREEAPVALYASYARECGQIARMLERRPMRFQCSISAWGGGTGAGWREPLATTQPDSNSRRRANAMPKSGV